MQAAIPVVEVASTVAVEASVLVAMGEETAATAVAVVVGVFFVAESKLAIGG